MSIQDWYNDDDELLVTYDPPSHPDGHAHITIQVTEKDIDGGAVWMDLTTFKQFIENAKAGKYDNIESQP